ncbi:MAG TPA: 7-cyano-7-deazaguanine synthase [Pyrinomonadaceae bacterium]|jgi:7-cyano-7-deazaguanine synthase in queuosine biosynthesis
MRQKLKNRKNNETFLPPELGERLLKEFGSPKNLPGLNAIVIGNSIFELEQELRERRVQRVIIPFFHSGDLDYDLTTIGQLIHELLIFVLVEDIEVEFQAEQIKQNYSDGADEKRSVSNICLFSGGTDSYSGILLTQESLGELEGVFCAHTDQARIIHIVANLQRKILHKKGIDVVKVLVPSIKARGYAQLRGFLYLLTATAVAQKLDSERIIVTECGPTMYQPRFSPFDSITMTTHPFVVRTAAQVASLLLHRELKVITPFENLTKAEVIAICPEKEGLKYTHSCITQRFGNHDGTCYGCVIRRLATIAAGVKDVRYNKNPISDPEARAGNLYSLLTFCYEILTSFNEMEEYETGIINTYDKQDLFRRFALDNFAAIQQLLSDNKHVVRPVRDMHESLVQKLGTQIFEDRLKQLAYPTVVPNFKKQAT